ncbi:MAG: tRNA dihydrouridine synthase DusB [Candidatus Latescibacteria bacterium]|jgi:tRNA-dihydrouridine synthase B|nr:tRNA dihydrouridine synthase DusB [Candidatus Latescibacterota bacterium]MBT4139271.1 tRNA dihydrouridine synthase DusB [Candidatus Latescibacterota bacterium]MBT5829158.1 tRNA dihydrouridine synthase DusB [Candidatus Latescibacterota bacterium]
MATKIGNVDIPGVTVLAPLAGVTDHAFRTLCREQGASMAVTEMVSARGLAEGSERSSEYLDFDEHEHPISVQVFGSEPEILADGAQVIAERKPDMIDLNCGCPVKKIVTRNAGAALLKDPPLLGRIISAMVQAVDVPVTLKIRSGWEDADEAVRVAQVAEDAGASAIAVHGRTREAKFTGQANWDIIARVKQATSIPVIGNGDVRNPELAKEMMDVTGCDLVMVGRWAIGNPWIFKGIETFVATGEKVPDPVLSDKIEMAVRHLHLSVAAKGPRKGVFEMRRPLAAYIKGIPGAAQYRQALMTEDDADGVERLLYVILEEQTQSVEVMG